MMEAKVPGGKLVRLRIFSDGAVRLSGDFFIYPEEGILVIENVLSGFRGDEPLEAIESALERAVRENGLQLVGLDVPVIARLYRGTVDVAGHRP
ncbi:conserved hypothetical protein [Methanocella paludicola SANAE]|uniref:Lipoate--protein ligase n=2 Tax=Methanocella TaxID=570266 RepID=D1YZC2_METPS|nr:conserved hypothetical protein [Methanocella paludicola SANAE]